MPDNWDKMSESQRETMRRNQFKPGVSGNPSGTNGWTKMRERYQIGLDEKLDKITEKLLELAMEGDVQAIGLALKPLLNVSALELSGPDGAPINFIELAKKAQEEAADA